MKRLAGIAGALLAGSLTHAADRAPLQALSDGELRNVSRPAVPTLVRLPAPAPHFPWQKLPRQTASDGGIAGDRVFALFPALLSADIVLKDVAYGPNGAAPRFTADGAMTLALPATIGELDVQNIRASRADASSFGAIQMRGIDMSNTVITVTPGK